MPMSGYFLLKKTHSDRFKQIDDILSLKKGLFLIMRWNISSKIRECVVNKDFLLLPRLIVMYVEKWN